MEETGLRKVAFGIKYAGFLICLLVVLDVLVFRALMGFGYERHFEETDNWRSPAPYSVFSGKPHALDHNQHGFRGRSYLEAEAGDFKIAFFGGSTGYNGSPPIPGVVERELTARLQRQVFVANYSVVSSNHRQHLHAMLERLPGFAPDLVIFYGGHNELLQAGWFDPRPGYPYDYFYRGEASPWTKVLLNHSALAGELDKRFGWFSGIGRLREEYAPFSVGWFEAVVASYFQTLEQARRVALGMESPHCRKTRFMAFYQPYQVPDFMATTHRRVRERCADLAFVEDVSDTYDGMGSGIYRDSVHVTQEAREKMGARIASSIERALRQGDLASCR